MINRDRPDVEPAPCAGDGGANPSSTCKRVVQPETDRDGSLK